MKKHKIYILYNYYDEVIVDMSTDFDKLNSLLKDNEEIIEKKILLT